MTAVAAQFAGFEKCERAVEIADTIPDETHKTNALSQIAQVAASQGLYELAKQAANEIDSELDRAITAVLVARAASNSGDTEKAAALLSDASDAAAKLSEPTMRHSAFIELSRAYFEAGDSIEGSASFDKAIAALLEVRNSTFQVSGLADLAKISGEFGLEVMDVHREMLKGVIGR
jgi:tetratricopeptide (TPR) repeat protein